MAEVDFNIVMTDAGEYIEVQGTAEGRTYPKQVLDDVLDVAGRGIERLFQAQREAIDAL